MSDHQPIDLDDLQRVAVLARERYGDNWVADMVEIARAEIARLREERRWIPVVERLPVEGVEVLCLIQPGCVCVGCQDSDQFGKVVWCDDGHLFRPTHWQPLPPPPGEGEVEE